MKRYISILIALVAIATGTKVMAVEKEAYAVYTSADNGTLTFYYDTQRSTWQGDVYSLNTSTYIGNMPNYPLWYKDKKYFETVVFTQSFSEYKPTITSFWFYEQSNLKTISNIVNLHTDEVTEMRDMFHGCRSLTSLVLSSFNTEKVTDMYAMFKDCSKLTSLDLSSFNTDKVTNMKYMFYGCSKLTSLDLSSFNTANITDMHAMFARCESLMGLDLSSFNTEKVTSMNYMFQNCNKLTKVYVEEKWSTSAVVSSIDMFRNCSSIKGELGTTFDENHVDASYARIDGGPSNPGYFSFKGYDVWVGGKRVNKNNKSDVLGDGGSVKYSESIFGKYLTLENANITNTGDTQYDYTGNGWGIYSNIPDLTIRVKGNNTIDSKGEGIYFTGNLSILGSSDNQGKLSVKGSYGICSARSSTATTMTIGGVELTSEGTNGAGIGGATSFSSNYNCTMKVGIANTVVKAKGTSVSLGNLYDLVFEDGLKIMQPTGAYFDGEDVRDASGNRISKQWVVIGKESSITTGEALPLNDNGEMINDKAGSWYTLDGRKLNGQPTKKGVYIHNGKTVIR